MTFDAIKQAVKSHVNLSSPEADSRIGEAINRHYRRITAVLGMDTMRFVTRSVSTTAGQQYVEFTSIEKIDRILDTSNSDSIRLLKEVSIHTQRASQPSASQPNTWANQSKTATSVTILLDTVPQDEYDLQADGWATVADLSGDDEPAFPESFHDILTFSVISEEQARKEKLQLSVFYQQKADKLLSELVMYEADTHTRDTRQRDSTLPTSMSGGGGGGTQGGSSYSQSGLVTFTHDPPFAVTEDTVVTDLNADLLDGEDGTFYLDRSNHTGTIDPSALPNHASRHQNGGADELSVTGLSGLLADSQTPLAHTTSHQSGGSDAIKLDDLSAPDDNTDLNASTSAHGLLRKLSNVATEKLNGQGSFAALTVTDLPTSGEWPAEDVSVSAGGGTESFKLGGIIDSDDTQFTTSSGSEETMRTYTLPASTLNANGRTLVVRAWGTLAADTDNKIVRIRLGGISGTIATQVSQNVSGFTRWMVEARVIRLALNSQRVIGKGEFHAPSGGGTSPTTTMNVTTDTLGETATIDILVTGTGVNAGDIVYEASQVEVFN